MVAVDTTAAVNHRAAAGVVVNRPAAEAEAVNHRAAVGVVVNRPAVAANRPAAAVATRASGEPFAIVEESRSGGAHRSAAFHLYSASDSRARDLSSTNVKAAPSISDADAGMPR